MSWAREHLSEQAHEFRTRFVPAMRGLELVIDGGSFSSDGSTSNVGRCFLGWTTERHWLLPG